MKGVAYLDADGLIGFRTQQFLDEVDPGFFSSNRALLLQAWRFSTEDIDTMRSMFRSMKALKIHDRALRDFAATIDFDMSVFRASP